jgi:hypothetical protein
MNPMRFLVLLAASAVLLTSCSFVEYNSTNAPRMVVVTERTPFYHNGPAQGQGPDMSLLKGDEVRVLRKEIGFSFVLLEDGQNGYVSNEDLKPAPTASPTPGKKAKSAPATATNAPAKPGFRY